MQTNMCSEDPPDSHSPAADKRLFVERATKRIPRGNRATAHRADMRRSWEAAEEPVHSGSAEHGHGDEHEDGHGQDAQSGQRPGAPRMGGLSAQHTDEHAPPHKHEHEGVLAARTTSKQRIEAPSMGDGHGDDREQTVHIAMHPLSAETRTEAVGADAGSKWVSSGPTRACSSWCPE